MGPTATGKTALSLALARHFPIEIINVDSTLIYRGLDILSGKPTSAEQAQVPHHLIDIHHPADPYSAGQFHRDALKCIKEIQSRNHIPVLVGGTMLYFKALISGIPDIPKVTSSIKAEIQHLALIKGWEAMHKALMACDPEAARLIHPSDKQRIERALSVYQSTGRPLSSYWPTPSQSLNAILNIALVPKAAYRHLLHQRIEKRLKMMLQNGGVEEVIGLKRDPNINASLPAMTSVGYRQVMQYLDGELSEEAMHQNILAATRQLAKRQLTWLRSWPNLHAFDYLDSQLIPRISQLIMSYPDLSLKSGLIF